LNLGLQNEALLLKHVSKFYNKVDVPWVHLIWNTYYHGRVPHATTFCGSFWWRDICKLMDKFRMVCTVHVHRGDTVLFWSDSWSLGDSSIPLDQRFARLFSFVIDPLISAAEVFDMSELTPLFHLPLSERAFGELQSLQSLLGNSNVNHQLNDVWVWKEDGKDYSAKKYYTFLHKHIVSNPILSWIWASCCTLRIKFFAWLLIMDRLNTQDMLERRHWNVSDSNLCVLCPTHTKEDRDHLFFQCNFSCRVWNYLQISWPAGDDMTAIAFHARRDFARPFFSEVVFLACWNIWNVRNDRVFRNIKPSFRRWRASFILDVSLLVHRIKPKFKDDLIRWISFLPP